MTVGSILHADFFDATIWGTGNLNIKTISIIKERSYHRQFDVRAVRGPLTKRVLESCEYIVPNIFGDPAILLPKIYEPKAIEKEYEESFIFHFRYKKNISGYNCIPITTNDYINFINEIVKSKKIISSSLHGIIIAEAYGVPALLLCEDIEKEDLFKYYDYYYSTKRYNINIATSIDEALKMDPMPLPENLEELREGLIKSFPYDLWK